MKEKRTNGYAIILLLLVFLTGILVWLEIFELNKWLGIILLPILIPVGKFCLTPLLTAFGVYKYHSPMLLSNSTSHVNLELHSGTLYDYWRSMRKYRPGLERKLFIMKFYALGLLKIVEDIESGRLSSDISIGFSSYTLESTLIKHLDFPTQHINPITRLQFVLNYLELIIVQSLSEGNFSMPKLNQLYRCQFTGAELVERKRHIERLHYCLCRSETELKKG